MFIHKTTKKTSKDDSKLPLKVAVPFNRGAVDQELSWMQTDQLLRKSRNAPLRIVGRSIRTYKMFIRNTTRKTLKDDSNLPLKVAVPFNPLIQK